ncbi:MAG: FtsQ-type POTRA domain-containing protein [Clostridia bacterium]|nr:FtsQ-type POTRA domain-containing protein [Clostridia bacterium]
MKAKKTLVIVLTTLIFLSCSILGFSAVFRIDSVQVNPVTISVVAKTEAEQLQERLAKAYKAESTFTVTDETAREIVDEFPYFRFVSFKKAYPNRIVVEVVEDAEVYAVSNGKDGYYILNAEGTVLGERSHYLNRSDVTGTQYNVLLSGFTATGIKGEMLVGDGNFSYLLAFCKKADELLGGIRRNVLYAEIQGGISPETVVLKMAMREGVNVYLRNPSQLLEEKTQAVIAQYLSADGKGLTDQQRTRGALVVFSTANEVKCVYTDQDIPNE